MPSVTEIAGNRYTDGICNAGDGDVLEQEQSTVHLSLTSVLGAYAVGDIARRIPLRSNGPLLVYTNNDYLKRTPRS